VPHQEAGVPPALEAAKRLAAVLHASKTDVVEGLLELSKKLHESHAEAQSLEMLTMARRVAEAIPTTEEAQKANALTGVASGLLDSGRSDSALPLYDEAAKLVRDSEGMRKRFGNRSSAEVLVNIAEGQCRLGQAEAAQRTLQAALVEARGIDEGERREHVVVDGHPGSWHPLTEKHVKFSCWVASPSSTGSLGSMCRPQRRSNRSAAQTGQVKPPRT